MEKRAGQNRTDAKKIGRRLRKIDDFTMSVEGMFFAA
jgi:hypothetical protein